MKLIKIYFDHANKFDTKSACIQFREKIHHFLGKKIEIKLSQPQICINSIKKNRTDVQKDTKKYEKTVCNKEREVFEIRVNSETIIVTKL